MKSLRKNRIKKLKNIRMNFMMKIKMKLKVRIDNISKTYNKCL